ncbi:UNVERIFIED_ORG: hypothetical protein M2435_001955 [Rhizobium sophorae]|uniref:ABC-three component system protein n=1 Tax=Rhizobium leguminosarum TaxID=384 RepID=UPI00160ADD15|nr:ABC-three component system protein [Rhizobium leguminosarum]MBB4521925.1 hypothetical protein [Rhizobium leguminosarum]MDH6659052.1 hypothetical protein [Rhizobium sophorae]
MPYEGRESVPVTQSNNDVGGHMGGRDVNVYANAGDVYLTAPADLARNQKASVFRRLFERLEQEANEDKVLTGYIRQLEIYTRVVENEEVVGLEQKLRMAGRDRQVTLATGLKENVFATLKANLFSPTYQMIAATLMAKVHERFESDVRHLIDDGADSAAIDRAVSQHIIAPFAEELEECPQFEDVAVDYVRGMVYFLTGNCHIRWDKC